MHLWGARDPCATSLWILSERVALCRHGLRNPFTQTRYWRGHFASLRKRLFKKDPVRSGFVRSEWSSRGIAMTPIEADCFAIEGSGFKSYGVDAFFRGGRLRTFQETPSDSAAAGLREYNHPLQLCSAVARGRQRDAPDWLAVEPGDKE